MNDNSRKAYVLRDAIMNLLSDEEVGRICTAETTASLSVGEEYVDLDQLYQGVRLAMGVPPHMGRILPRRAVHQDTWTKILSQLTGPYIVESGSGEYITTPRNAQ